MTELPFKTPRGKSLGTVAFVGALGLTGIGVLVAAVGSWRQGAGYVGAALLLACLARMVLPDRMSGLLRVRRKAVDVVILGLLGGGIVVLALLVPDA
ncbi:MAG: DUF3017 domain-containing protein [Propionibacteriales bacterium]|nr:DUF3017 domain-containing protein [Propionibacteriales bacterium]